MAKRICLVLSCAIVAWSEVIYRAYTPNVMIFLDFSRRADVRFLNFTMPFIVGKVGTHIKTNYQFINYGNMPELVCGARHLKKNSLHQAIYHMCKINKGKKCFTKFGVFEEEYKACILNDIHYYHQDAIAKFRKRGLRTTPALFIEKQFVKDLEQESLLKRICAAFLRKPAGCLGEKAVNISMLRMPSKNFLTKLMLLSAQKFKKDVPQQLDKLNRPPLRVNNVPTTLGANPEERLLRQRMLQESLNDKENYETGQLRHVTNQERQSNPRLPPKRVNSNNARSIRQGNHETVQLRRPNNAERQNRHANNHAMPQKQLNTQERLPKPENKEARQVERVNSEARPQRRANNKEMLRNWARRP